VLFNAAGGLLWRRFTTYLHRHLARLAGLTFRQLRDSCRVRYVKVAEYQARGVIHYHAIIRLDAPGDTYQPPPAPVSASVLCEAITSAAAAVSIDAAPPVSYPEIQGLTCDFVQPSAACPFYTVFVIRTNSAAPVGLIELFSVSSLRLRPPVILCGT